MNQRGLVVLTGLTVLAIGGAITWHCIRPEPVITEESARAIRLGMTKAEVRAILGGPAGDYTGGDAVTYSRGGVGADESGYSRGTNWWGTRGVIQVHFSKEGLVEVANYYPAHSVSPGSFWSKLWVRLKVDGKGNRHGWIAAYW
jgi:hypothetical protein